MKSKSMAPKLTGKESLDVLLAAAIHPDLSQNSIKLLCTNNNKSVRRAILSHPKIGTGKNKFGLPQLERLAREFPEEVANESPAFFLHVLIDPSASMRWVVQAVASCTKDPELIRSLLKIFDPIHPIRAEILSNPHAPEVILESVLDLEQNKWTSLCKLAQNNACTPILFDRLYRYSGQGEDIVRMTMALNPSLPLSIMKYFCDQKSNLFLDVRVNLARNTASPVEILRDLGFAFTEPSDEVRMQVLSNPNAPIDLLVQMSDPFKEPNEKIRNLATEFLKKNESKTR